MKTVTHICDICKKSKSEDSLCRISVRTEGITIEKGSRYSPLEIDICGECLEKKGFVINPKPDQTTEEIQKRNSRSLEDKLIDILEDLNVAFCE